MDRLEPQSIFIFPFLILIVIQNISSQGSLLKKSFFSDHPKLRLLVATPETFHCVQTQHLLTFIHQQEQYSNQRKDRQQRDPPQAQLMFIMLA